MAARGIDISGLPYVVNMTLPSESEDYIHRIGRVGRADRIGLAISIVATQPEKVWYHKCPSRGANCSNTRLVEEKGCCIWQNEMELKAAVERRLGGTQISELDPNNLLAGRELMAARYGLHRDDAVDPAAQLHLELLRPAWRELAQYEMQAQHFYFLYQRQYHKSQQYQNVFDRPAAQQQGRQQGRGQQKRR
eukprot:TRINITY_DN8523_c0_g1_i5.p1 TRINITY_DN8523_c0_g1~~TRINITY_DN8523_c0_g1_i5.p1  ORF type:complete len:192 (-),score=39.65 TRINITY_DN8523_c0_g1_i5:41-616(-)